MRWIIVAADRIAEPGLAVLRAAPDIELVSAVGDAAALRAALPRAHALLVRDDGEQRALFDDGLEDLDAAL